jgi:C1A family cysteine protease
VKIDDYCGKLTPDVTSANLQRDMMANGPVHAGLNANQLQHYTSGIFHSRDCPTEINHSITIVGWGIENGIKYWIIKNSWGTDWGEKGYFRIKRGVNMCGISTFYYFPYMQDARPYTQRRA